MFYMKINRTYFINKYHDLFITYDSFYKPFGNERFNELKKYLLFQAVKEIMNNNEKN